MRQTILTVVGLSILLAGCGGPKTYADSARSGVQDLRSVIQSYNDSAPADVAATGEACSKARDDLKSHSDLNQTPPAGKIHREGLALRRAYQLARTGFTECAAGASANDYARMAGGAQTLTQANQWLARARGLER